MSVTVGVRTPLSQSAQGTLSASAGHTAPPFAAGVFTVRVRFFEPVPLEHRPHDVHEVQSDTMQPTGQLGHACVCDISVGHAAPPLAAACEMLRVRIDWQLAVHAPQADHADVVQSTATDVQFVNVWLNVEHTVLFSSGFVHVRLRDVSELMHGVHVDHSAH